MSAKVSNAIVPASVVAVLLSSAAAADEASVRQSMQTKYPGKAYTDMMLNGKRPGSAPARATRPSKGFLRLDDKRASVRPTLFFADGHRVAGAIPADQLIKILDNAR